MTSPLAITRNWGVTWVAAPDRPGDFIPTFRDGTHPDDIEAAKAWARARYATIRRELLQEQREE